MNIQKSFSESTYGTLYVVPTPIGNLEDITIRALNCLRDVSLIAAEDTRNTKKLLNHFEIATRLISYHEHNKAGREEELLNQLRNGEDLAIVSDAGMPAISDPGEEIVQAAIREDLPVVVLPGANAALCGLVGSGISAKEFYFYGFLPRKKKEKAAELTRLAPIAGSLLFYESPHRVKDTLKVINEVMATRNVTLARELTKRFEEYIRGTAEEVLEWTETNDMRGEFVIIVEGGDGQFTTEETPWWEELDIKAHVEAYMEQEGLPSKQAIKQVATDRQLPKRDIYQAYHIE